MTGPPLPSESLNGVSPQIRYCVWEITLACDLGCKHCGSRAAKPRSDELSTAECLDVVEQLAEIGCAEVTLIGGEAYLRDDFDVIARAISDAGMRCGITTGARDFTEERLARAAAAGVRQIGVSIDGLEDTHDALRGAVGSWRSAVDTIDAIRRHGMRVSVNSQVNRLSLPELAAMASLLVEHEVAAWQVQLTVPMGRAADRPELLLQPSDLLELFPLLVWIKQTRLDPGGVRLTAGNNIGYYGGFEKLLRVGGDQGAVWASCAAGTYTLGLEADGAIKGCPSLPTNAYTGGNLRRDRLRDIVENAVQLTHIRERTVDDLWGFCRSCKYAERCMAGCTWTSHVFFGRPGNNPYCVYRALEHEANGQRERLVRVEAASGNPFDHGVFEIVLEGIEQLDESAAVLGVDLKSVLEATPASGHLIDPGDRKERLRRRR